MELRQKNCSWRRDQPEHGMGKGLAPDGPLGTAGPEKSKQSRTGGNRCTCTGKDGGETKSPYAGMERKVISMGI
jgi:hypothetical protein